MSTANNRRPQPGGWSAETIALWCAIVTVTTAVLVSYAGVQVGHRLAGLPAPSGGLWETVFGLLGGDVAWPDESTAVAAATTLLLLLLIAAGAVAVRRSRGRRSRVDDSARYLGRGRDIESLTRKSTTATARRLGVDEATPGVPIGTTVSPRHPLYGSWEDMHIDIWGPRTGKTTSRAVPAILAAPGAVLVTSNKRDVVDATRDVRLDAGPVWVFDPQGIAGEPNRWWWNPLDYVTDEVQAAKMAEHFAAGSRDAGARTDAYFDPAGQDLLAGMLLAAALDQRPITDVYRWLTRPTDETPVEILTAHGYDLTADQVAGVIAAPDKQRAGVFGTAQQMASCLTNRTATRWVTPDGSTLRARFDAAEFVRSGGTLYSLSKEGKGTSGPLVTALTVAVVEAGESIAATSRGGRLPVPLLGVLDEAANVCRWRELPNLYSHYGSRGIVLMTILQSWSQGVDVWGESGMKKLWSAANIKVYGGGVSETAFLDDLAKLIGSYDRKTGSVSINQGGGRGGRQVSHQLTRERILDVDELAAMPKGRAVVLASGARPTLIRTQPWMAGPYAAAVEASIRAHDPQAEDTITDAADELHHVEQEEARRERSTG